MSFDEFQPETVEEQVEQFSQKNAEPSASKQVVQDLQAFYANDASMIEKVWQRLEEQRADQIATASEPVAQKQQKRSSPMYTNTTMPKTPMTQTQKPTKSVSRFFTLLAAALISVVLISSIVIALGILKTQQNHRSPVASSPIPSIEQTTSPTHNPAPSTSPPAPSKERGAGLYVVDNGLYRLNPVSGAKTWFYDIKADPNTSPFLTHWITTPQPAVSNGVVYIGGNDLDGTNYQAFYLYALNATTGRRLWRVPVESEPVSVMVTNDSILLSTTSGSIYAFKTSDHSLSWSATPASTGVWLIALDQGIVYGESSSQIFALDAENGQQHWNTTVPNVQVQLGARLIDGALYLAGQVNSSNTVCYMYAYNAANGQQIWQSIAVNAIITSAPSEASGTVYFGAYNGQIYALNAQNGRVRWQHFAGDSVTASTYLIGNTLVIGTVNARITAYDATTGNVKWSKPAPGFDGTHNGHDIAVTNSKIYYSSAQMHAVSILNLTNGELTKQIPIGNGHGIPYISVIQ